ncbi:putative peptidoglycan lipid II flippase [Ruminococcaceae bacterium R-25]|nr:putative peptidoglycan lipid II flippase [Ruminococcaceae bacterium R-25]SUQ11684.1 putative peptidoglycan lipid II flippase [Oscillospiraceae bacterium]
MAENTGTENKTASSHAKKGMSFALSTIIVGLGLIITKGSGLIRDVIVSWKFTEPALRDAYMLAFNIPDLFYNLLVGGAIYSTIAPFMSAQLAVGREKEAIKIVSKFITAVSIVMIVCCSIGAIFSEPLYEFYSLFHNVKNPEILPLAAQASKLLFPQIFFIMLAALCNGILIAYRRFTITSFAPVLYNILVITAIYVFGGNDLLHLMMTTGGILIAAVFNFLFQYVLGFKQMRQFKPDFHLADRELLKLFKRAIPILISASVVQINAIVLNSFALQFDKGSVYCFRNANSIWQIPYSVFVVAITTVMTPELSGDYEAKRFQKASNLISHSMRSALFMTIPSAVFIGVMNVDVVKAIYQWHSAYTNEQAEVAATFLLGFCSAIVTATVVHVFNQAFYAIGQTKIPLFAGILGLVINPVACSVMIRLGVGLMSLSFAYSITNIFMMVLLAVTYCRRKELAPHGIVKFLLKAALCVTVMGVVVFIVDGFFPARGGKLMQLGIVGIKLVIGIVVYFGMAAVLRMQEATEWINKFKAKIFKKKAAKQA